MSDACVFCRIIRGETPARKVLDDDTTVAFLDHRPLFPGHCLVAPREHHPTLADLPAGLLGPLFARVQRVALAVEAALEAEGSFVAINNRVSQSVPHLHVHVVPRRRKDGLKGFFWPRTGYRDAAHEAEIHERVRRAVELLGA
jgi:histidine triad (HIT) family protein